MQKSCVLFDLGGVIVNWHNKWFIEEISQQFNLKQEVLQREFNANLKDISTGVIAEKEFWQKIGESLKSPELSNTQESLLDKVFRKRMSFNDKMIELSKNLAKNGITVGILSNTEHVTYSVVEDLLSLTHFKHKFLSYKIGHLKPEPQIYQHVINNIPFEKEQLFFIDDLKSNVESAKSSGIDAVQYSDFNELLKQLQNRNILI
jgi:putative hydrolase of the HAD superfamily